MSTYSIEDVVSAINDIRLRLVDGIDKGDILPLAKDAIVALVGLYSLLSTKPPQPPLIGDVAELDDDGKLALLSQADTPDKLRDLDFATILAIIKLIASLLAKKK